MAFDKSGAFVCQIAFEGGPGPAPYRNDAGLVTLAGDPEEAILKIQRFQSCGADFGETQTGRVEEFQDRKITASESLAGVDGLQQLCDLGFMKCLRQVISGPGGEERLGGVVLNEIPEGKKAEEDLEVNHCDAEGGGLQAFLLQPGEELPEVIDVKVTPGTELPLLGPVCECLQAASYGELIGI